MKKIILIILIASILVLSGCDLLSSITNKIPSKLPGLNQEEKQTTYGGTGTLETSIVNPKKSGTILNGYPFQPVVRIKNLGGSESYGQVCITGLDQDVFSGFSGCECLNYQQRRVDETFEDIDLKFGAYNIQTEEEKAYALTAINRFKYGTNIKAEICITADIYEDQKCSADISQVTSGPLKINSIEETIIPLSDNLVTIIFRIEVDNVGDGNLWDLQRVNEQCVPFTPIDEDKKKIKTNIIRFPVSADLQCQEVKLDENDEAIITCEAKQVSLLNSQGIYLFDEDYKPEVIFELEYAYETRESNTFSIK
ncbi:MAG: hypothetical protein KKA65_04555 [Nanoarchaeota archaeon]|nr:hypothetical protein [Nanoarchaeota archaeon]MBU4456747.1 hypothetical protein [Nanoarchaeota archaeon]MCG2719668.1 hypothetical protein [Nanoarchaeota archaeon]